MILRKDQIALHLAVIFVVSTTLIINLPVAQISGNTEGQEFPFKGAKMIYNVEGKTTLGYLIGNLTYTVEDVSKSSYEVKIGSEGNIDKLPNQFNQKTRELERSSPLFFSEVIEESSHVGERVLEIGERQINVKKYHRETEKEFGKEKITVLIPEEVKIPLIVKYSYGDRFRLSIELNKTNVKFLQ